MASSTQKIEGERTERVSTEEATSIGLDENVAGALSYVSIVGLVLYFIEKENGFVRFHAAQSIALAVLVFGLSIGLSVVGTAMTTVMFSGSSGGFLVGSLVSLVLGLLWLVLTVGGFALWVYLIVRAYQGKTPRVPIAAGIADKMV